MAKKVLIIDDDKDILEMLDIVLEDLEYEVILSDTGMTVDEIKAINPDVILLDVQIKGYAITGDLICLQIKSCEDIGYIKILLVSGEENLKDLAINCSADGYLSKPFDITSLKSMIADNLD